MEPTIFHTNVVLLQVHCFDNNLHLFWTNKELLVIRFDMQMREGRGTLEPNNSFLCWNIGKGPGFFLKLSYLDVCERFTIERCLGNHMYCNLFQDRTLMALNGRKHSTEFYILNSEL